MCACPVLSSACLVFVHHLSSARPPFVPLLSLPCPSPAPTRAATGTARGSPLKPCEKFFTPLLWPARWDARPIVPGHSARYCAGRCHGQEQQAKEHSHYTHTRELRSLEPWCWACQYCPAALRRRATSAIILVPWHSRATCWWRQGRCFRRCGADDTLRGGALAFALALALALCTCVYIRFTSGAPWPAVFPTCHPSLLFRCVRPCRSQGIHNYTTLQHRFSRPDSLFVPVQENRPPFLHCIGDNREARHTSA